MEFDRTAIRVRERGANETLDLALHVIVRWWWPLWKSFLVVVVPLAVANGLLMEWVFARVELDSLSTIELWGTVFRYGLNMALLVILEAPLASSLMVPRLGLLVFEPDAVRDRTRRTVPWRPLARLWSAQLLFRGVGIGVLLLVSAYMGVPDYYSPQEFVLLMLVTVVVFVRTARPYLPEVILLEKLARSASPGARTNLRERMRSLHRWAVGETTLRGMLLAAIVVCLSFAGLGLTLFVSDLLFLSGVVDPALMRWGWPLALWVAVFFATTVRFLNYLDLRVRSEGWEIELQLRAEAARLEQEVY